MANKHAVHAVRNQLANVGDDLARAKMAAKRVDPSKEWGQSGQTLAEIIAGYQTKYDGLVEALKEMGETP